MKKYKIINSNLLGPAFGSINVLVISAFFFMAGISAGIFLELMMSADKKVEVIQYLLQYLETGSSANFPNPFSSSLLNNFLLLLIIFIAGLSIYLFPAALLALFFKGLTLGFSACLIIEALSFKGIFFIFLSIIPQNLLFIPAFIFAASGCVNFALSRFHKNRKQYCMSFHLYCISFLIPAAMIFLGCVIEGFFYVIVF